MTFRTLLADVRAEASGIKALDSVRVLAGHHRVQASPGFDAAAAWLAGQLRGLGLEPEIDTVPGDGVTRYWGTVMPEGWSCERATATLIGAASREPLCDYAECRLSLVQRSAPGAGRYPIVTPDGDGTEDAHYLGVAVAGRVVLAAGGAHRVHTLAVVERGAAGILCDGRRLVPPVRGPTDDPDQVAYTSFWWSGDEPRGWGFVVSPQTGAGLRARLARGEPLELDVEVVSRRFATPIPLVSARIPGTLDDEVLVVAHLCHPQPSANDNASGVAAALETARVLQLLATRGAWRPRRGVRFLWMPELTGTHAWLASDPARTRRITAAVNLDMVGEHQDRCGSTFLLERPPCFAASFAEDLLAVIRAEAVDWVTSYSGPGHYSLTRMSEVPYSGGSDHAVFIDPAVGVPCPMLIQWPDLFYHSSHDTPDKTDPRSLELAVRCAATYAGHLAALDSGGAIELLDGLARRARGGVLRALDAVEPRRAAARAAQAGGRAIASLARLGVPPARLAEAFREFEAFVAREAPEAIRDDDVGDRDPALDRVPRRHVPAPLDSQRHLLPGFAALSRGEREAMRVFEREARGGATGFELAWYACDGTRDLRTIASLVKLETGLDAREQVRGWFEWTARLGLSEWASTF